MATSKSPFATAERYIELRRICAPRSWGDLMIRINEMILTPLITIFFILFDKFEFMSVIPAAMSTYRVWSEWIEFSNLRFQMQQMYLTTMKTGGPFIVTNDPDYLPYVYADAVVRHDMLRQDSATERR
jgi:hypothetical protein